MKINNIFSLCLLSTLCCGGVLFANSPKEDAGSRFVLELTEQVDIDSDEVASLPESSFNATKEERKEKDLIQIEAARSKPAPESSLASSMAHSASVNKGGLSVINSMATANALAYASYPGAIHSLIRFHGKEVRLEDGSWWKVYAGDFYQTSNWISDANLSMIDKALGLQPDKVVLTANSDWPYASSYRYHLTNQATGKYVRVNLNDLYSGLETRYIYSHFWLYDSYGSLYVQLTLNDGSIWNMLPTDFGVTGAWKDGDIIIVGMNTQEYSSFAPYMLINVRTNNNSPSACVLYYN